VAKLGGEPRMIEVSSLERNLAFTSSHAKLLRNKTEQEDFFSVQKPET
jgi:hypothetical protein